MPRYVVDSNLYIDAIRRDDANAELAEFQQRFAPFLLQHSTVAQEILSGARTEEDYHAYYEDWVAPFEDLGGIITPGHSTWTRAARIIVLLVEKGKKSPGGFSRSFLNDCLIAASSTEHDFVLITRNSRDFDLIRQVEPAVRHIRPWPER